MIPLQRLSAMLALGLCMLPPIQAREGNELLGKSLPEWQLADWQNAKPLKLKNLEGRVVLVRWWTGQGCPFCAATAPALNEFHQQHKDQGLVVVGVYHSKSDKRLDLADVKDAASRFKFQFPIAVDHDWKTLKTWWLDGHTRRYTSVSFLIDRQGNVRHVHPGGTIAKGDEGYRALKEKIEELVRQK
jgi:peroxiredoxin